MYIPKDIHGKLKREAAMAKRSHCNSWARLFLQASYLIRQQEREIKKLNKLVDGDIDKWLDKVVDYTAYDRVG
jgi:hypothetical protein